MIIILGSIINIMLLACLGGGTIQSFNEHEASSSQ